MNYVCEYCGKICKSKISKSCHERFCELNPNKASKEHLSENAIKTNKQRKNNQKTYITFIRKCEVCHSLFSIVDVSSRKSFPKCCSSICSHKLTAQKDNKNETKDALCEYCGETFKINKRASNKNYTCSNCRKFLKLQNKKPKYKRPFIKIKKTKRNLTEDSIKKLREAGKKSAKIQAEIRRSKNEMKFCELCVNYFENVRHNEPIFNGWDADVIIEDIKFAVLWNGKVHYEPIFGEANYNRVINRDKIKIKEIERCGYKTYIIKDTGKHNNEFVNEKFLDFVEFLKQNKYIINI